MKVKHSHFTEYERLMNCENFAQFEALEANGDIFIFYATGDLQGISEAINNEIEVVESKDYNFSFFDGWYIVWN